MINCGGQTAQDSLHHVPLCSTFYREAVDNVVTYNAQLVRDAKARLPYVDAQTGIAQSHSYLLQSRLNRKRGVLPGQVFSYPQRRWKRETRPVQPVKRGT